MVDKEPDLKRLIRQKQCLPLEVKIAMAQIRIERWHRSNAGNVYVSFSGGKDSTVLLDLVRSIYPNVPAVFIDTGLEYPEVRKFVKTIENVVWVKPKAKFKEVIMRHGYPVISKKVAMGLDRHRNTQCEDQKKLRLFGGINPTSRKKQHPSIPKKWHFLTQAPFKISERCCYFLKKSPITKFEKVSGLKPFVGVMAKDSFIRQQSYIQHGCNMKNGKQSRPIMFWVENDIWAYIKKHALPYSKIYDMGEKRTGCMWCMFGVHMEEGQNRFQRMKTTHPKLYRYCIEELGIGKVLDTIGVKY